jgi:uncharacterized membrane protein
LSGDSDRRRPSPEGRSSAEFIERAIGPILALSGSVAMLAAIVLSVEKVRSLEDPSYVPTCSIDEVLSCGSVIVSDQAEAFGFPNPFIGIAGFAALATIGVVLIGGAQLPRWLWLTVQAGITFALGFVVWLIFQSVYRIEALCPYCMVVWAMTITAFVYVTAHNVAESRLPCSAALRPIFVGFHGLLVTGMLLIVVAILAQAFWDHWQSVL